MNAIVSEGPEQEVDERDPRKELTQAFRRCTARQRSWLRALPDHGHRRWATAMALGISKNQIHRWLRQSHVQRVLNLIDEIAVGDLEITNRRILQEYARIAFADIREVLNEKGTLLNPDQWPEDLAAAVSSIETEERAEGSGEQRELHRMRKVRMHSKLEALKALATYRKLITERHELTGPDGEPLNAAVPVIQIVRYDDGPGDQVKAD